MFTHSIAGQFLLEESRLIEAAEMAKKAAELDNTEFDVVFNAAHMLRLVLVHLPHLIFLFFWRKKVFIAFAYAGSFLKLSKSFE